MAIAKCETCKFYSMCKYREGVTQIQSINIEIVNQTDKVIDILVRCKNYNKKEK